MAPERYRQWLGVLRKPPRMHVYADRAAFARRLLHMDRHLTPARAEFLSKHLARIGDGENKAGQRRHGIIWNGDPWHKAPAPYLFRLEESMAIWRQVTCPVLWVAGRDSWVIRDFATRPGDWEARQALHDLASMVATATRWPNRVGDVFGRHLASGRAGVVVGLRLARLRRW
jgi:pimeloyl-ACP methyl ester carboxylesterase